MHLIWKIGVAIVGISALAVGVINANKEGGAIDVLRYEVTVLRDEVPELAQQWAGSSSTLTAAAYVPASLAVAAGIRAGDADYDKSGPLRSALTSGIPFSRRSEIMRNDNFAAAKRARNRVLRSIANKEPKRRFYKLFPYWWSNQTACLSTDDELELIRELTPSIAGQIYSKNAEFKELARREKEGILTVSERATYLADNLRVPHLVRTGTNWYDWAEVDPSGFSLNSSDRPVVRACPEADHSHGRHIQACFDYVNIDLYAFSGQSAWAGQPRPTVLARAVFFNLKQNNAVIEFVLRMMKDKIKHTALRAEAEQNIKSMLASEVTAANVEWHVRAEYERLRCQ